MRHFTKLFTGLGGLLLVALLTAATAVAQQDGKIVKVVGKGTATISRNGTDIPVTENMAVQVGDVINTGAGVDVFVQPYPGALATLKPNSHAKLEELQGDTAMLDLRGGGNIVAQIEPNKGHQFGVRTPKGVAAAKGTVFSITIAGQDYTVVTLSSAQGQSGGVQVFTGNIATLRQTGGVGANVVTIQPGQAVVVDGLHTAGATAAVGVDNPAGATAIQSAAQIAVAAVAQAAANNLQGGNELAQVMQTVVQNVPNAVASVVATAAAAAPTQAANVVKAAVDAATTPAQALTIAQAASQGAAQGVVQANNGNVDSTVTNQITDIAKQASQSATQKNADASTVASAVSTSTTAGAGAGVTASGGSLNSGTTGTDLAKAAANGSTNGAITGSGSSNNSTASQNIANSASSGAAQGFTNSGGSSSNLNLTDIGNGAVSGASNAGTTVAPPTVTPPNTPSTPVVNPPTTPTQPVNPDLSISPSS